MKLVPGARVEMQGPKTSQRADGSGDIIVRDARSEKERRFVPHGHEALVIGVVIHNPRDPILTTWVTCFSPLHGFFRVESSRVRVVWSPVKDPSDPEV